MTVHDTVHGFIVEREVPLPELDAVMYQMKHEKTGLAERKKIRYLALALRLCLGMIQVYFIF